MRGLKLRGWNGILELRGNSVVIRRGVRGRLVRKCGDAGTILGFDQVAAVRYSAAAGVVGFVQVVERGRGRARDDYLTTIRDPQTVTFATRSRVWLRLAEEVAARAGVTVEVVAPAAYWQTVMSKFAPWLRGG